MSTFINKQRWFNRIMNMTLQFESNFNFTFASILFNKLIIIFFINYKAIFCIKYFIIQRFIYIKFLFNWFSLRKIFCTIHIIMFILNFFCIFIYYLLQFIYIAISYSTAFFTYFYYLFYIVIPFYFYFFFFNFIYFIILIIILLFYWSIFNIYL